MVGDKQKTKDNLAELKASLAPSEAEVGAMAKADQYWGRNTAFAEGGPR